MAWSLRGLQWFPSLLRFPSVGIIFWQTPLKQGDLFLHGSRRTTLIRHLATKKTKAKGKGQARVSINASLVEDIINLDEVNEEMLSAVKTLQENFNKTLAIRTNPGALDHILVATPDGKFPLNHLAHISLQSPQLLVVSMSSFPESTAAATEAIRESGMNLNPEADGPVIRVPIPKRRVGERMIWALSCTDPILQGCGLSGVTREHRESLVTVAKQLTNKAKESLRKVRAGAVSQTKKAKGSTSEDTLRLIEKQIQQMTEDTAAEMDKLLAIKTKELLG